MKTINVKFEFNDISEENSFEVSSLISDVDLSKVIDEKFYQWVRTKIKPKWDILKKDRFD